MDLVNLVRKSILTTSGAVILYAIVNYWGIESQVDLIESMQPKIESLSYEKQRVEIYKQRGDFYKLATLGASLGALGLTFKRKRD